MEATLAVAAQLPDCLPVELETKASRNPVVTYIASLASPISRNTVRGRLRRILRMLGVDVEPEFFPWQELRREHVVALRTLLAESGLAPNSANAILSSLRSLLRECRNLGLLDGEAFHRVADIAPITGSTIPKGRCLSQHEMLKVFEACASDPGPSGARDCALLAVCLGGGLRRGEIVALDVADFDPEEGALKVRRGKFGKSRVVFLPEEAVTAIERWLAVRGTGEEEAPLFTHTTKGRRGRVIHKRLSTAAVFAVTRRRAKQAGVASFTPHDGRRTAISSLLDAGADISSVAALAGHSSVNVTQKYDRRGERAAKRAARLLRLPIAL